MTLVPGPVKNRGIYFDAETNEVDYLRFEGMYMHYVFSLQSWILVKGTGALFTNTDTERKLPVLSIDLLDEPDDQVVYTLTYWGERLATSPAFAKETWTLFFLTAKWVGSETEVNDTELVLYVNDLTVRESKPTQAPMLDELDNVKRLGNGWSGYMTEFKIYNYLADPPEMHDRATECGCGTICPSADGFCLNTCEPDEYLTEGNEVCTPCNTGDMTCQSEACVRPADCNLCNDPNCKQCATFSGDCLKCN
jgi:hypothetical protein